MSQSHFRKESTTDQDGSYHFLVAVRTDLRYLQGWRRKTTQYLKAREERRSATTKTQITDGQSGPTLPDAQHIWVHSNRGAQHVVIPIVGLGACPEPSGLHWCSPVQHRE